MNEVRLKATLPLGNGLGECILWDERHKHVLWTDIPGKRLYTHAPETGSLTHLEFDEDLCSFALIQNSDDLLCAFKSGFAHVNRHSGERVWLHRIDNTDKLRLNDGRVDRQGRFWCGSLIDNEGTKPEGGLSGELFRFDSSGEVSKHLDGIGISNSICWSPDGTTMYFGDTPTRRIQQFDFDTVNGTLSNGRLFATTPKPCGPDGSVVDAEGFLWNAEWGQGRVVRYASDGSVNTVVQLPVSHVTCVTFGGDELTDLYVTTANFALSEEEKITETQAGDVFIFETPYRGLIENRFVNSIDLTGQKA
jgi:sugar lactone lactonase YvrE